MNKIKLPKGWKYKRLGDMFTFVGGGTPSKAQLDYWNGSLNWASVKDVKGDFLNSTKDFITEKGLKNSASNVALKGDVILITRISPGKSIITNIRTAINQDLKIAKPKFKTTPKFIYYFFSAIERDCIKKSSGTTVLGITLNNLNELLIPDLSLEEQDSIVSKIEELFSELDKGIEDLKTAQQQLKTYRQSVLKYAFEGKLTNKKVKDGVLPKGWNIVKLDNVADITSSKRIFQNEYVSNGVPFYRTKEVKELSEGKELTIELFISNQKYEEIKSKYKIPQIGDILLSAVGTIGISYVIKDEKPFYFKDGNLMWFRDLKNINSYYLHYGLINFIKNGQGANTSGSAYNALTISTMKDFNFPLPSNKEQHQIVLEIESRLSVADKMEESISQSLQQAEVLRQSILKMAFSGELV